MGGHFCTQAGHIFPSANSDSGMLRNASHSQAAVFFLWKLMAPKEISADPNLSLSPCSWKSHTQFKHSLFLCPRVWWHFSPAACHAEHFNWKFVKDFRSSSDWKGVKWGPRPWNAGTHGGAGLCALPEQDDCNSEVSQLSRISSYKRMCIPNGLNCGQKHFLWLLVLGSVWTFLQIIKLAKF